MSVLTSPRPTEPKSTGGSRVVWVVVAVVGAICWSVLALSRGEEVSAVWILFAALSSYAIAYRFYARFIAYRVLRVDDSRATPAEKLNDGRGFDVTDRRVLFGHHFGPSGSSTSTAAGSRISSPSRAGTSNDTGPSTKSATCSPGAADRGP